MIAAAVLSVMLLMANAGFVAMEFALVGARSTRLEPLAAEGRRSAVLALAAMRKLNLQLAGAQLGITLASLSLGYVTEPLVVHGIEDLLGFTPLSEVVIGVVAFVVGLGLVVFAHMVVGEMVPKNLAITAPERTLMLLVRPNRWYLAVFGPVVWVLNSIANVGMRILRITPRNEMGSAPSADDLARMLLESHREGLIERDAQRLLTGVLDFGDTTVADVMVLRDGIVSVTEATTVAEAEQLVATTGHSRLPVFAASGSEPLGFVHAKDLLGLSANAGPMALPLRLVRRMPVVARDRSLEEVLVGMQGTGVHVALVVDGPDADGSVVGLVTLEDLLEELVGDITDETDPHHDG
jgi:CBS domain containing-hemolysin-like protein